MCSHENLKIYSKIDILSRKHRQMPNKKKGITTFSLFFVFLPGLLVQISSSEIHLFLLFHKYPCSQVQLVLSPAPHPTSAIIRTQKTSK